MCFSAFVFELFCHRPGLQWFIFYKPAFKYCSFRQVVVSAVVAPRKSTQQIIVSAYRYIATTTLAIIAVFFEYLRQFLIDLHQTYRHSSVPKTPLRVFLEVFSSSGFRARRRRDFFCQCVRRTVLRIPRLPHTSTIWLN